MKQVPSSWKVFIQSGTGGLWAPQDSQLPRRGSSEYASLSGRGLDPAPLGGEGGAPPTTLGVHVTCWLALRSVKRCDPSAFT